MSIGGPFFLRHIYSFTPRYNRDKEKLETYTSRKLLLVLRHDAYHVIYVISGKLKYYYFSITFQLVFYMFFYDILGCISLRRSIEILKCLHNILNKLVFLYE